MPGELAALRSPEIPSVSGSGFIQSPEIPPARNSRLVIPSTPQTPTPGPSNRPLGSPIRYMSPPEEFPLDPTLQRAIINPGPTSISATSNIGGSGRNGVLLTRSFRCRGSQQPIAKRKREDREKEIDIESI